METFRESKLYVRERGRANANKTVENGFVGDERAGGGDFAILALVFPTS